MQKSLVVHLKGLQEALWHWSITSQFFSSHASGRQGHSCCLWHTLAEVSTRLRRKSSCKPKAEGPSLQTDLQAQGEEKVQNNRVKKHKVSRCSWLTGADLRTKSTTGGKGFPRISHKRLVATVLHFHSSALCSNAPFARLGPGVEAPSAGSSVGALTGLGRAPLQPTCYDRRGE